MSMKTWAEKEIELACEQERKLCAEQGSVDDASYGVGCYKSALKAYNSLMEDGHSGMSIGITKGILNRLIEGKCLTPIEDTEDVWSCCSRCNDERDYETYQCKRMSSLFKYVYTDGSISYSDVDRVRCCNLKSYAAGHECWYSNGFITRLINSIFPIEMPYAANQTYYVFTEDFLFETNNGDYDTLAVVYMKDSKGDIIDINRYFKECEDGFVEISKDEYDYRYEHRCVLEEGCK